VTEQGGSTGGEESPAMRAFLAKRRVDVLRRAIVTLETCSPDELAGEAHRLAGTLGIFGFDAASTELRSLQREAEAPSGAADEIDAHRMRTLAMLRGFEGDAISEEPG
jgi:Hpt domain